MTGRDWLGLALLAALAAALLLIVAGDLDEIGPPPTLPTVPATGVQAGIRAPARMSPTPGSAPPDIVPAQPGGADRFAGG